MNLRSLNQADIEAFRKELAIAKIRSNLSLLCGASALVISVWILCLTDMRKPSVSFQNLSVNSLQIGGNNSEPSEVLDSRGITFLSDKASITFGKSAPGKLLLSKDGLASFDEQGSEVLLDSEGMILTSKYGSGPETHYNNGSIFLQTPSNYIVAIGPDESSGDNTAGIRIYKNNFDAQSGKAGLNLTPQNIELNDDDGNERVSIGRTALTNSNTGSNEVTGPSSILLFDKAGHVVWQEQ